MNKQEYKAPAGYFSEAVPFLPHFFDLQKNITIYHNVFQIYSETQNQ